MASARPTVLIIDDDTEIARLMTDALEPMGFKVVVAHDGGKGIDEACRSNPNVILLDFYMPGGGGDEVYERLRSTSVTALTPVVFTSAASIDELRSKVRPGPQTYFLKKPVSVAQIRFVLNQVLGLSPAMPEAPAAPEPGKDVLPLPAEPTLPEDQPPSLVRPAEPAAQTAPAPPPKLPRVPASGSISQAFPPSPPPPAVAETGAGARRAAREVPDGGAARQPRKHEFEVRVTYADTDKMGVIYYANYFRYFEQGRTELMRSLGIRYRDLEAQQRLYLPVVETRCEYFGPCRYDDLLLIRTWMTDLGLASINFEYEIYDRDRFNELVARGSSHHALVDAEWQPARVPNDLRNLLAPLLPRRRS
ncbi:MAG: YbgC/FadM family acyl-CoA thioesterase [Elusimicrobia bacterium]|nr:YbgC/FadM family acyl-CoA thioesterase [Elusimicrobiota bacterium]